MKRTLIILPVLALVALVPQGVKASELPKLDLFTDEIYLKEEVSKSRIPNIPAVLGASTDDSAPEVAKKLGTTYTSYFRDVSFKAPADWYVADDYDDTSLYTYAVNDAMTAQISIERFDAGDATVSDLSAYVEVVCSKCGYKVTGKGTAKVGNKSGAYVEASNGVTHLKYFITVKDEVGYVIELLTPEEDWSSHKKIMEKSIKSLKIKTLSS